MDCFEALVVRYEGRLLRFLEQRCGNRHDAEDLTQRSLISAYQALDRFDCDRSFGPWLFQIARRQAISHGRRRRFEALPPEEQWPVTQPQADRRDGPMADLWTVARHCLPERLFSLLWFRYGEEMTVSEAARAIGVTELHARVLLHRARHLLAETLRKGQP